MKVPTEAPLPEQAWALVRFRRATARLINRRESGCFCFGLRFTTADLWCYGRRNVPLANSRCWSDPGSPVGLDTCRARWPRGEGHAYKRTGVQQAFCAFVSESSNPIVGGRKAVLTRNCEVAPLAGGPVAGMAKKRITAWVKKKRERERERRIRR